MKNISIAFLTSVLIASMTGCALNPFAEDNIYNRENKDVSSSTMNQPSAPEINRRFEKVDADKNGLISKQEAESIPGLVAVFDRYNPDRDGTLDWNEFTSAMQSRNLSRN